MSRQLQRPSSRRTFARLVLKRSLAEFRHDDCPQFAAAIAYHVLFALFPLVIVLTGIFGVVVHLTGVRADVVDTIVRNVPLSESGATELRRLLLGATSGLSALGLLGLLGLIWSASGMMAAVRVALNKAWDTEEVRPYLRGKFVDVGLVFGVAVVALLSIGLTIAVRVIEVAVEKGVGAFVGTAWVGWVFAVVVPLVLAFGVVLFFYRVVPATTVSLRDAWPAALFVAGGFVLGQNLFALYVSHFADYNAIYGSLGAVIAFMFFVYLSSMIFLLGAELASETPRVRRALEDGEIKGERKKGERGPLTEQAKNAVKGLWVQSTGEEADAQDRDRVT